MPGLKLGSRRKVADLFKLIEIRFSTQRAARHFGTFFDSLAPAQQLTSTVLPARRQADVATK